MRADLRIMPAHPGIDGGSPMMDAQRVDEFVLERGKSRIVECRGDDVPGGQVTDGDRVVDLFIRLDGIVAQLFAADFIL